MEKHSTHQSQTVFLDVAMYGHGQNACVSRLRHVNTYSDGSKFWMGVEEYVFVETVSLFGICACKDSLWGLLQPVRMKS